MGILQLKTAIKTVGKSINLEPFRGKKIAIDTSCFLYQFLRSEICRKVLPEAPLIFGFIKQIKLFHQYNITPVYVFDGKPTEDKIVMDERRKMDAKKRDDLLQLDKCIAQVRQFSTIAQVIESIEVSDDPKISKISDAITLTDEETVDELLFSLQQQKNKKELQAHKPNSENIGQLKVLFEKFGIPTIQADAEADAMLAKLNLVGLVDAVMTIDTDQFAFGTTNVLLVEKDVNDLVHYKIEEVQQHLGLTRAQFVDFCILCGCDYLKRIGGIGVVGALKFIKLHQTIENVLASFPDGKFVVPEDYLENVARARELFIDNPFGTIPETATAETLQWNYTTEQSAQTKEWFSALYPGLSKQFGKALFPVPVVVPTGPTQGTITSFFEGKKPSIKRAKPNVKKPSLLQIEKLDETTQKENKNSDVPIISSISDIQVDANEKNIKII